MLGLDAYRLKLNARGVSFDFAKVSQPYFLAAFQHGEDLLSVCFVLDVEEVDHLALIPRMFSFFFLAIKVGVLQGDVETCGVCSAHVEQLLRRISGLLAVSLWWGFFDGISPRIGFVRVNQSEVLRDVRSPC